MNFIQFLFAILMLLPPAYGDNESWSERKARMMTVATAIDTVSSWAICEGRFNKPACKRTWPGTKKQLAMILITKGFWESRFALNVHEGKCRKWECDPTKIDGRIVHKARGVFQTQKTGYVQPGEWEIIEGTSLKSTVVAATVATRALSGGYHRCGDVFGAISIYSGIGSCRWSNGRNRLAFYQKLMQKDPAQTAAALQAREAKESESEESQLTSNP